MQNGSLKFYEQDQADNGRSVSIPGACTYSNRPDSVGLTCQLYCFLQDRYRELLRVSREWRDLHNRMRGGAVHDRPDTSIDGGLALFCPACPQMDINVPPSSEWKPEDM